MTATPDSGGDINPATSGFELLVDGDGEGDGEGDEVELVQVLAYENVPVVVQPVGSMNVVTPPEQSLLE